MRVLPSFFILLILLATSAALIFGIYQSKQPSKVITLENKKQLVKGTEADRVVVESVTDGDTLVLTTGKKVRLIGINAPEKGQPYYNEAKQALADLVEGKSIDMQFDVEKTDQYGRTLSYIYVENAFVNKLLIEKGVTVVETIPPNVLYSDDLVKAQKEARKQCRGIWEGLCKQTDTSCIQISTINADLKGESVESKNSEWIEIMNTCLDNKNLSGYLIKDSSASNSYTFKNVIIRPRQKIKLHSGCSIDSTTDIYWQCPEKGSMVWNNIGDHAFLYDNEGKLISEMAY